MISKLIHLPWVIEIKFTKTCGLDILLYYILIKSLK
jgi:hypothetical protein